MKIKKRGEENMPLEKKILVMFLIAAFLGFILYLVTSHFLKEGGNKKDSRKIRKYGITSIAVLLIIIFSFSQ